VASEDDVNVTEIHLRDGGVEDILRAIVGVDAADADGGGRASAIGGTLGSVSLPPRFGAGQVIVLLASVLLVLGAMVARDLFQRAAATAAAVVAILVAVLTWWYFDTHVVGPVSAGYGFYIGAVCAAATLACSIWSLVSATRR
jgi:hypothetical protein